MKSGAVSGNDNDNEERLSGRIIFRCDALLAARPYRALCRHHRLLLIRNVGGEREHQCPCDLLSKVNGIAHARAVLLALLTNFIDTNSCAQPMPARQLACNGARRACNNSRAISSILIGILRAIVIELSMRLIENALNLWYCCSVAIMASVVASWKHMRVNRLTSGGACDCSGIISRHMHKGDAVRKAFMKYRHDCWRASI